MERAVRSDTSKMKIFQRIQNDFETIGLGANHQIPFNSRNLLVFFVCLLIPAPYQTACYYGSIWCMIYQ